jgi:4-hydroxybenzoyl-CoA reductase subunit alpha
MLDNKIIGQNIQRSDSIEKATGKAIFTDDIKFPGMLYGKLLLSKIPHGIIKNIDISKAKKLNGVKCIITGKDIPKIKYGNWRLFPETQDEYALAIDKVRFIGDEIAAVAAISKDIAEEALDLIKVEYEELNPVFNIEEAIKNNAPIIHKYSPKNISVQRKINYGNLDKNFNKSDIILEDTFNVQSVNHAYMEPCSCIANSDLNGKITLWTSTQAPFIIQCLLIGIKKLLNLLLLALSEIAKFIFIFDGSSSIFGIIPEVDIVIRFFDIFNP